MLGDLASHGLDLAAYVLGDSAGDVTELVADQATFITERPEPSGVVSHFSTASGGKRGPVGNEDQVSVLFRYASGARGVMECSRVAVGDQCRYGIEIRGDKGALAWDFRRMGELEVCLDQDYLDASWQTRLVTPQDGALGAFQPGAGIAMGYDDLKVVEAEHFVRSIAEKRPIGATIDDMVDDGGPDRGDHDVVRRATLGRCDRRRAVSKIRVGVIGTGAMGTSHVRMLSRWVSQAQVVTAYDADVARVKQVCQEVGARTADGPESVIGADDVDAVLIAAPDPLHQDLVLSCIAAGKPVLCEKPLATSAAGSQEIVDAEVELGLRLVQVGFMRRYDPAYVALRSTVADGDLGAVRVVHCVHRNPEAHPSATSEGIVSNSMIHELDTVPWLLDDTWTAVTMTVPTVAEGALRDPQIGVLETAGGVIVTSEVFVNARLRLRRAVRGRRRRGHRTADAAVRARLPPGRQRRLPGGRGLRGALRRRLPVRARGLGGLGREPARRPVPRPGTPTAPTWPPRPPADP